MNRGIRIELLGGLRLLTAEAEHTRFRTRKTGALLAYLAYHARKAHTRESLIDILWPDCALPQGRVRLSDALSSLRQMLEPPGVAPGSVLRADRFSVQILPDAVSVDVFEFTAAIDGARQAESDLARTPFLADAVRLYSGVLLPDYYEEWISGEQRRLAGEAFWAIRRWIAWLESNGDLTGALAAARRAFTWEPQLEESHRDLIRVLIACGQTAEARRQYQELEKMVAEEYDDTPSAESLALAALLDGPSDLDPSPRPTPPTQARPRAAETLTLLAVGLPASDADAWADALPIWEAHDARCLAQGGDSLLLAFPRVRASAECALRLREALSARAPRLALASGELAEADGQWQGLVTGRVGRLLQSAHPGQILCGETTAALLRGEGEGIFLADLGLYRIPEQTVPGHVYELEDRRLPSARRAPQGLTPAQGTPLPPQATRFFGRAEQIDALVNLFPLDDSQLVTLSGPGGSGKTRLALEVGQRLVATYRSAVWFVPLADVANPDALLEAIHQALRIPHFEEKRAMEQIIALLSRQPSLLILDNLEHLVEAGAGLLSALFARVPCLGCLVTSRHLVGLSFEREWAVEPLALPQTADRPERIAACESVQLFRDRAQMTRPDFQITPQNASVVAALCRRLEGIPLALELAAARAQVMTPKQILDQLDDAPAFLVSRKRDVAERHRTLDAAIDWSYQMLPPDQQAFLTSLSVFRGGWSLAAAEAVCGQADVQDRLIQLRECSLIQTAETDEGVRFRLLEVLRQYAARRLAPGLLGPLQQKHTAFFLRFAAANEQRLQGPESLSALHDLDADHENLLAALEWAFGPNGSPGERLTLAGSLSRYWIKRGALTEGRRWLERALDGASEEEHPAAIAKVLNGLGFLCYYQGDFEAVHRLSLRSETICRRIGERWHLAVALSGLSLAVCLLGSREEGVRIADECLAVAEADGDPWLIAFSHTTRGACLLLHGRPGEAIESGESNLPRLRTVGDVWLLTNQLNPLGLLYLYRENYGRALALYKESLPWCLEMGNARYVSWCLEGIAFARQASGDASRAAWLLGAADSLREITGSPRTPYEHALYERKVPALRRALGEADFDRRWQEGRVTPLDEIARQSPHFF